MSQIYSLVSDDTFIEEFTKSLRNRELDQKFLYQWDVAELYYQNTLDSESFAQEDKTAYNFTTWFAKENIFNSKEKTAFISLWCWNSHSELDVLNNCNNWNIGYYWIDSSIDMLNLSIEKMKDYKWDKKFFLTDFSSEIFKNKIQKVSSEYSDMVYSFFWTFWNIKQTHIIDILTDMLSSWDKLWISIALRNWTSEKDNFKLFQEYTKILDEDKIMMEVYFRPLKKFWVPYENWKMWVTSSMEESVWAQKFTFYFEFNKKTEISIEWNIVIFLPWEKVLLQNIYEYEESAFTKFFEEHHFKLINSNSRKWLFSKIGQFLFEKE